MFSTIEKRTKEASWGDTGKIWILVQYEILDTGENLLTTPDKPYPITTKLEEVEKYF